LPPAFLVAAIMAFGRLAGENEINAMRVGGVPLWHVVAPVLVLAVLLSGVAAYFQFYVAPAAQREVEFLKYHALKQILLEKVALSAHRQMAFYPYIMRYEDFRDGEMKDVVVVELDAQTPTRLITAQRGIVGPDADKPERIVVRLFDAHITQLGSYEFGGPGTTVAREVSVPLQVAPEIKYIAEDPKLLTPEGMLVRMEELKSKAPPSDGQYINPSKKIKEARQECVRINARREELRKRVESDANHIRRTREGKLRAKEATIEAQSAIIKDADEQRQALRERQIQIVAEIERLKDDKDAVQPKMKELRDLTAKIEELDRKIAEARAVSDKAARELKDEEAELARKEKELAASQAELDALDQEFDKWSRQYDMAKVEKSLREIRVRFNQKFALGVAVLAFAMIGVPLGVMTRRRGTMMAFGVGFAVVLLLFYPCTIIGRLMGEIGMLPVGAAMWLGNAVTFVVGLLLLLNVLSK
jgi:lipopolysaccharide export LptBFGC system permease protein LptF